MSRRQSLLLLVLILCAGGVLRFCFKIGISCVDDYGYLVKVVEIWSGEDPGLGSSILNSRSAFLYPMAYFAKFFGLSEWTTLAWSLSCALVEITAACFIGYLLGGIRCGLLAALFLSFFPPHVILSYRMMPDIILSSFNTISVSLFILAHKLNKHQAKLFVLSGVMLGIAYLVKASALLSLLFFGLFIFCSIRSSKRMFFHGAFFCLGVCRLTLSK